MRALKELVRGANPDMIFLSETKIKTPKVKGICNRLKLVDSWCVDLVGKSGGLALFWRLGVDLEVVFSDKNMIVALVYSDPPKTPCLLFAIYGPYQRSKKKNFWSLLNSMVAAFSADMAIRIRTF